MPAWQGAATPLSWSDCRYNKHISYALIWSINRKALQNISLSPNNTVSSFSSTTFQSSTQALQIFPNTLFLTFAFDSVITNVSKSNLHQFFPTHNAQIKEKLPCFTAFLHGLSIPHLWEGSYQHSHSYMPQDVTLSLKYPETRSGFAQS